MFGVGKPKKRIHFEVLDPDLGCLVPEPPNLQIHFEVWDPAGAAKARERASCGATILPFRSKDSKHAVGGFDPGGKFWMVAWTLDPGWCCWKP